MNMLFFFFSSRRRHTRCGRDWSSDVCSSDLQRLAQREVRFVDALRRQVAARSAGPLARLLTWAGWTIADIEAAVRQDGLEVTLGRLRDDGVFFTHAELTGAEPLRRPGLELPLRASDFDNATRSTARLGGSTSGSR